jgi:hypothetical protein
MKKGVQTLEQKEEPIAMHVDARPAIGGSTGVVWTIGVPDGSTMAGRRRR